MKRNNLDNYDFSSYEGFNAQLIRWRYEELKPYFFGKSCLELGSSDGQGTEYLLPVFERVVAVDGSQAAVDSMNKRISAHNLETVCSYFEDLDLGEKFDTIVLAHILEHVDTPSETLAVAKRYLRKGGQLIVDVPNANSIHRQLGVEMGMLKDATELNDADRSIGHQRVYTPDSFKAEVELAGFQIKQFGGIFLKVLSNSQTEEMFSPEQLLGFLSLGKKLPEIASEIYIVATA